MASTPTGGGGSGRRESLAIFVAMLGILGSVATLIISDVMDDSRRARQEEEAALVQLDRAIIGWEKRAVDPTLRAIADQWQLGDRARKLDDTEREQLAAGDWRHGWDSIVSQMSTAEEQFENVREAHDAALRETEGGNYDAVKTYYESALVRLQAIFYARNLVPDRVAGRPTTAEARAIKDFRDELSIRYRFSIYKDVKKLTCPEHGTPLNQLEPAPYAKAMSHSIDCLEGSHFWFADAIRSTVQE